MIEYYNDELKNKSQKQKKELLTLFFIITAIYVLYVCAMFFWETTLVYDSNVVWLIRICLYSVSLVYLVFAFIFVGIKIKRVSKVVKLCKKIDSGIIHENEGTFFEYSESLQENYGVDFKALIFLEWNQYKKDYFERKVLVFYERPFPELEKDKAYRFVTKGNILMKYEEIQGE